MREILFRGRSIQTRTWYEGELINTKGDISPYVPMIWVTGLDDHSDGMLIDVDPDTVGQYTGLTDKNGKRIFEWDVLRIAKKMDGMGTYYFPEIEYPVTVVVKWDMCAWLWETIAKDKRYISFPDAWCHFECEVIGNIYDNPELMEV